MPANLTPSELPCLHCVFFLVESSSSPEIIRPLVDQSIPDKEPCCMQCRLSVPDGATISWYHDDRILTPSEDPKQTFVDGVARLEFMEVFPDDVGVYKCVVVCDGGMAETTAILTVLGNVHYIRPVFKRHSNERTPSDQGTFSRMSSYFPHVKEPVMKGHLSCWDTFSGILKFP